MGCCHNSPLRPMQKIPANKRWPYFNFPKGVYAAGRLDKDSEGLLVLTDDGPFIKRLTDPKFEKNKVYWVQVEGAPTDIDFNDFRKGLMIQGKKTRPAQVKILKDFDLPPVYHRFARENQFLPHGLK